MMSVQRKCVIESAGVGHTALADDDGAYDLLDVEGTPQEVGKAIADSLATCDLTRGGRWAYLEHGQPVWLVVVVRIDPVLIPDHEVCVV